MVSGFVHCVHRQQQEHRHRHRLLRLLANRTDRIGSSVHIYIVSSIISSGSY